MPQKTTEAAPLDPVTVTVIGHGDVAGGPAPMLTGTVATTPLAHQPNLITVVVSPLAAILVRAAHVFLNTLLGGLGLAGGGALTGTLPWATWRVALMFAVSAALINAIQSSATIFGKLEGKFPLLTGTV